jgi:hypothetical protein
MIKLYEIKFVILGLNLFHGKRFIFREFIHSIFSAAFGAGAAFLTPQNPPSSSGTLVFL